MNETQVRSAHAVASECLAASSEFRLMLSRAHRLSTNPQEGEVVDEAQEQAELVRAFGRVGKAVRKAGPAFKVVRRRLSAWSRRPIPVGEILGASYHEAVVKMGEWLIEMDWVGSSFGVWNEEHLREFSRFLCVPWERTDSLEVRLQTERDRLMEGASGAYDDLLWQLGGKQGGLFRVLVMSEGDLVPNEEIHNEVWPRKGYEGNDIDQTFRRMKLSLENLDLSVAQRAHRVRGGCILTKSGE